MNLTFTAEVELYHLSKVVFWFLHCQLCFLFCFVLFCFVFLFKLEVSCEETIWGNVNILFLSDFESK